MKKFFYFFATFAGFNLPADIAYADQFYWSPSSGNFSAAANWKMGSYGGSTASNAPGSGDTVHIGNGSNNATVTMDADATISVLYLEGSGQIFINGSTKILSVTGDINISNSNSTGGGSSTIKLTGTNNQTLAGNTSSGAGKLPNLTINKAGGTVTLTNYITMGGSTTLTYTAGTIDAGTSTVVFYFDNTITGNFTLNDVEFMGTTSTCIISNTLTVSGNLKMTGTSRILLTTGAIELYGDLNNTNTYTSAGQVNGTATIKFKGTNNQSLIGGGLKMPNITIDKSGGTLTLSNTITMGQSKTLHYVAGTLDAGSSLVVFYGPNTITGSFTLNDVEFLGRGQIFTVNNTLTVNGNFYYTGVNQEEINTGTILLKGDMIITNTWASGTGGGGSGAIKFTGTANQHIYGNATTSGAGRLTNITVDKSGGTLTLHDRISFANNTTFRLTAGTVNAGTSRIVCYGTVNFYGGWVFNDLEVYGFVYSSIANVTDSITVKGNIYLTGAFTSYLQTGKVKLEGDFNNGNSATPTAGAANLCFTGSGVQSVTGSYASTLYKITMNKTGGYASLSQALTLTNNLTLTKGNIVTTAGNLLTIGNGATVTGASDSSFVSGPVKKIGNQPFTFPTGKGMHYHPIEITAPSQTTDAFTAEYFNTEHSNNTKDTSLTYRSGCEYWTLNRTAGTSNVKVKLYWNENTCDIYTLSTLKMARLESGIWKSIGAVTTSGNTTAGNIVTNSNLSSFDTLTIGKKSPVVYANAGNDTTVCSSSSVTLGASPSVTGGLTPYTYSWYPTDGLSSATVANPVASSTATISYILTVTDLDHSVGMDTVVITVHESPYVNAGRDTSICLGQSVLIGDTASGGTSPYTYAWSPGITLNDSTIAQPTAVPSDTTEYILTVTDSNGCPTQDYVIISTSSPVADAGSDRRQCYGDEISIGGGPAASHGESPYSYAWINLANSDTLFRVSNPSFRADSTRNLEMFVIDHLGCTAKDTMTLTVSPSLTVTAGRDTFLIPGQSVTLGGSPTVSGGTSPFRYTWSALQWLSDSTTANPVCTPFSSAIYHLDVTDTMGCWNGADVAVKYSPLNLGRLEEFAAIIGDSIIVGDTSVAIGKVIARHYVSNLIQATDSVIIDSAYAEMLIADLNAVMDRVDTTAADTISSVLDGVTLTSSGYYRIDTTASLNSTLTFSGNDSSYFVLDIDSSFTLGDTAKIMLDGVTADKVFFNIGNNLLMGSSPSLYGQFHVRNSINGGGFSGEAAIRGGGPELAETSMVVSLVAVIVVSAAIPNISLKPGTYHTLDADYYGMNMEPNELDFFPNDKQYGFDDPKFQNFTSYFNLNFFRLFGGQCKKFDWNSGVKFKSSLNRYYHINGGSLNKPEFISASGFNKDDDALNHSDFKTNGGDRVFDYRNAAFGCNANLMLTFDMVNSNKDYQMLWLDQCRELDILPKYVELGNEHYLGASYLEDIYPRAYDYMFVANRYLDAIHSYNNAHSVSIKAGVTVASVNSWQSPTPVSFPKDDCRESTWAARMNLPTVTSNTSDLNHLHLNNNDALIFHVYPKSGLGETSSYSYASRHIPYLNDIKENMFTVPFYVMNTFKNTELRLVRNSNVTLEGWITEFNLAHRRNPAVNEVAIHGTWAHGLYFAEMVLGMLEAPEIKKIAPQAFMGNAIHNMVFKDDNGFDFSYMQGKFQSPPPVNTNGDLLQTIPFEKTGCGHVAALLGKAFRNCTAVQQINFGSKAPLAPDGVTPLVYGWQFINTDGVKQYIILNLTSSARYITNYPGMSGTLGYESASYTDPTVYVCGNHQLAYFNQSESFRGYSDPMNPYNQPDHPGYMQVDYPQLITKNYLTLRAFSITRVYEVKGAIYVHPGRQNLCANEATSITATGASCYRWTVSPSTAANVFTVLYPSSTDPIDPLQTTVRIVPSESFNGAFTVQVMGYQNFTPPNTYTNQVGSTLYTSFTVYTEPSVSVTIASPSTTQYCSTPIQLSATSNATSPSFWWSPTEGLADVNSAPTIQGTNIYASPLQSDEPDGSTTYSVIGIEHHSSGNFSCYNISNTAPLSPQYIAAIKAIKIDGSTNNQTGTTLPTPDPHPHLCSAHSSIDLRLYYKSNYNNISNIVWNYNGDIQYGQDVQYSVTGKNNSIIYASGEYAGCRISKEFGYIHSPNPSIDLSKTVLCQDEKIRLEASGALYTDDDIKNGFVPYAWSPTSYLSGASSSNSNPLLTAPPSSGSLTYSVTATNSNTVIKNAKGDNINTCPSNSNTTSINIDVVGNGPSVILTPSSTIHMFAGASQSLSVTSPSGSDYFYQWTPGIDLSGITGNSVIVTPQLPSSVTYTVNVINSNISGNSYGCCGSNSINVIAHSLPNLYYAGIKGVNQVYACTATFNTESTTDLPTASYQWVVWSGGSWTDIGGEVSNTFTAASSGTYACRVTLSSQSVYTPQVIFVKTGCRLEDLNNTSASQVISNLHVFPNPGDGQYMAEINNENPLPSTVNFRIFNSMGNLLFDKQITVLSGNQTLQWQLPIISPAGLYFAEIELNNSIYKSSFIKIK